MKLQLSKINKLRAIGFISGSIAATSVLAMISPAMSRDFQGRSPVHPVSDFVSGELKGPYWDQLASFESDLIELERSAWRNKSLNQEAWGTYLSRVSSHYSKFRQPQIALLVAEAASAQGLSQFSLEALTGGGVAQPKVTFNSDGVASGSAIFSSGTGDELFALALEQSGIVTIDARAWSGSFLSGSDSEESDWPSRSSQKGRIAIRLINLAFAHADDWERSMFFVWQSEQLAGPSNITMRLKLQFLGQFRRKSIIGPILQRMQKDTSLKLLLQYYFDNSPS